VKLDNFIISIAAPLREVLLAIEANHHGMIFFTDGQEAIVGVATDGDIRRHLLEGGTLDDQASLCANTDFVWEKANAPRESLLKKLDHQIRLIPLLDDNKRLVGLVSRDHLPVQEEGSVYARARAPVRISFGGGGSDLTHYFAGDKCGAVINTTVSLYSHAALRIRTDEMIFIQSMDLGEELRADNLSEALKSKSRFDLIQALLKAIRPDFGFELYLHSDFPMKSGLGGSSVVSAAILGCFNQFRRDQWDSHEIAEISYQAERHHLNVAGGWQDQYAAVFGGFNFMEFRMDQNIVHPLRIPADTLLELEESLILCDTGTTHESGDIHEDQRKQMAVANTSCMVQANVDLSYEMRNHLLRGRLRQFAKAMDQAWHLKRQLSKKISSPHLDQIYSEAKANGATAGKLLGAGGGGFFLFYVPAYQKHRLISHLQDSGLGVRPFRFESNGLQAWTVRENMNH